MEYPDGFIWGAATAAHQVEGGNWNSDWWEWEHNPASLCVEPSGDACDQYHRYEADFDLMVEDLDATHRRLSELGRSPSEISKGKVHSSFTVRDPSGQTIVFNSSHVSEFPV